MMLGWGYSVAVGIPLVGLDYILLSGTSGCEHCDTEPAISGAGDVAVSSTLSVDIVQCLL